MITHLQGSPCKRVQIQQIGLTGTLKYILSQEISVLLKLAR